MFYLCRYDNDFFPFLGKPAKDSSSNSHFNDDNYQYDDNDDYYSDGDYESLNDGDRPREEVIQVEPEFQSRGGDVTVDKGTTITLSCIVDKLPGKNFYQGLYRLLCRVRRGSVRGMIQARGAT